MAQNATFYFQSNRRRGRSGEVEDLRPPGRPDALSSAAVLGRLAVLDEQVGALDERMGALLRGEWRVPDSMTDQLTAMHQELVGLSVALQELARLREEVSRLTEGLAGMQGLVEQFALQLGRIGTKPLPLLLTTAQSGSVGEMEAGSSLELCAGELEPDLSPPLPELEVYPMGLTSGEIAIEPVTPRLQLGEIAPCGPESVLRLDAE
jgi:hypothetical protein